MKGVFFAQENSNDSSSALQGKHEVYQFIVNSLLDGKKFIIQQAFPRLKIEEKHFDIRVYIESKNI